MTYPFLPIATALLALLVITPGCDAVEPGTGFHVVQYKIDLNPDLQNKSLIGVEVINFRSLTDGLRTVVFSGNALTIDNVTMNGKPVQISKAQDVLSLDLPKVLKVGKSATLRIAYHGAPKHGVTFTPVSVYTSYAACDWMICSEDTPGDKAIFTLNLHVPAGMTSIASGIQIGKSKAKDGTEIHRWRTMIPYSAYLYDFAMGNFISTSTRQDGAELVYLSDVATAPELETMFEETGLMVKFLSEKAGMGLPAKSYTQLLVAGNEAQEAATYSIIGRNTINPKDDWAIIHELAHQWWGNSITCASWKDFWLNEGFATYMTAAWKQQHYGQDGYEAEMKIARTRYDKLKAKGLDWPLAYGGEYPSLGARRVIQYSKGALFLDHLRTLLGDDAFWAGIRSYTLEHAGGTVTSIDFKRSMEKASGRDLSDVFAEWVFGK